MKRTALILAQATALAIPAEAFAQQACGAREKIVAKLETKWGETLSGGGFQSAASIIEVFMSEQGGTWTILRTNANGTACVLATGTDWLEGLAVQKVAGVEG